MSFVRAFFLTIPPQANENGTIIHTRFAAFLGLLDNNRRAKLAFSYKIVKLFLLFSLIFC